MEIKELEQYKALEQRAKNLFGDDADLFSVVEELKELKKQPKADWIPCEERLPSEEQNLYWTTHEDGSVILHGYTERDGFIYNWEVDDLDKRKRQGSVVAWMLIEKPQPYKKEGAE